MVARQKRAADHALNATSGQNALDPDLPEDPSIPEPAAPSDEKQINNSLEHSQTMNAKPKAKGHGRMGANEYESDEN